MAFVLNYSALNESLVRAGIAQSVEHFTRNEGVVCSSHITSSILENTLASLPQAIFILGT